MVVEEVVLAVVEVLVLVAVVVVLVVELELVEVELVVGAGTTSEETQRRCSWGGKMCLVQR